MSEKQSNKSNGRGGKRAGAGRPSGALDKGNAALREMILGALSGIGGQGYLERVAESHPAAFMSLLGRVLPTTLDGEIKIKDLAQELAALNAH